MKIQTITSATGNVLSLKEAKLHIRLTTANTDHDAYLNAIIPAAEQETENYLGRRLMFQKMKVYFDYFPAYDSLEIPFPPLRSIPTTGLVYTNSSDGSTTFSSSKWSADTVSEPGRLVIKYDYDWPSNSLALNNPIAVEFNCGYSSSGTSSGGRFVPALIKHAIKLTLGDMYEDRENTIIGQTVVSIPMTARRLLDHYRIKKF